MRSGNQESRERAGVASGGGGRPDRRGPAEPPPTPPPPAPAGVRRGERAWEEKGLQVRGETSRRERAAGSRLVWGESALYKSEWK